MLRASKYNRRMEFQIIMGLFVINLTTSTWFRYVYIILSESVLAVLKFEINVDHNYTNGTSPSQKKHQMPEFIPTTPVYIYVYRCRQTLQGHESFPEQHWASPTGQRWSIAPNIANRRQLRSHKKSYLFSGWWYTYTSEKIWKSVTVGMINPNIWKNNPNVPDHQPYFYIAGHGFLAVG